MLCKITECLSPLNVKKPPDIIRLALKTLFD